MRITCLVCLLLVPGAAFVGQADEPADFYFDEPRFSIAARGSRVFAGANSDLFDFFSEQLTSQRRDFGVPARRNPIPLAAENTGSKRNVRQRRPRRRRFGHTTHHGK